MIDRLQSFAKSPLEIQPVKIHPDVCYIAREDYIKNKRSVGRHKDLADLESLGEKP
jgi:hypothetical protein